METLRINPCLWLTRGGNRGNLKVGFEDSFVSLTVTLAQLWAPVPLSTSQPLGLK